MAELSPSQSVALAEILSGACGFLTGSAGTGKSFVLREAVAKLRESRHVVVTATTGIASVLCEGVTIHSVFKLFPDDSRKTLEEWIRVATTRVRTNRFFRADLRKINTLVIDEVSMMDPEAFAVIDACMQTAKGSGAPFGGIQLILVGDFCQLPAVQKSCFLFEKPLFWNSIDRMWELKEIWRQRDPVFCGILQRARFAENTLEDMEILRSRVGRVSTSQLIPTRMFSKNVDVDTINNSELKKLGGTMVEFHATCEKFSAPGISDPQKLILQGHATTLLKNLTLAQTMSLCVGSQIMLAFNMDTSSGLVNGSRGVVVDFRVPEDRDVSDNFMKKYTDAEKSRGEGKMCYPKLPLPVVQFSDGRKILIPYARWSRTSELGEAFVWQIPLRLAWASTIHRSQGATLEVAEIAIDSSVFEAGQAYVALSRVHDLESLCLSSFDPFAIRANDKVKAFYGRPFELQRREFLGI